MAKGVLDMAFICMPDVHAGLHSAGSQNPGPFQSQSQTFRDRQKLVNFYKLSVNLQTVGNPGASDCGLPLFSVLLATHQYNNCSTFF